MGRALAHTSVCFIDGALREKDIFTAKDGSIERWRQQKSRWE